MKRLIPLLLVTIFGFSASARNIHRGHKQIHEPNSLAEQYGARANAEWHQRCQADIALKHQLVEDFAIRKGSSFTGQYSLSRPEAEFGKNRLDDCSHTLAIYIKLADGRVCDVGVLIHNPYHREDPNSASGECK
jgi:hypothetical protein